MRAATTRIQHLSVAPAKVTTALPQWTATTKPRKLQPAHRCPRNRKLLRTALNSTQQSLPRYTVGASLAHLLRATTSTPTSRPCLSTHLQLTPQQTTRSRTDLSEMHRSLECVFQLVGQTASNHTRCTGTFAPSRCRSCTRQDLLSPVPPVTTRPVPTKPQTKRTPCVIPQTPGRTSTRLRYHVRVCHFRILC